MSVIKNKLKLIKKDYILPIKNENPYEFSMDP
jgi:hypothetical protein